MIEEDVNKKIEVLNNISNEISNCNSQMKKLEEEQEKTETELKDSLCEYVDEELKIISKIREAHITLKRNYGLSTEDVSTFNLYVQTLVGANSIPILIDCRNEDMNIVPLKITNKEIFRKRSFRRNYQSVTTSWEYRYLLVKDKKLGTSIKNEITKRIKDKEKIPEFEYIFDEFVKKVEEEYLDGTPDEDNQISFILPSHIDEIGSLMVDYNYNHKGYKTINVTSKKIPNDRIILISNSFKRRRLEDNYRFLIRLFSKNDEENDTHLISGEDTHLEGLTIFSSIKQANPTIVIEALTNILEQTEQKLQSKLKTTEGYEKVLNPYRTLLGLKA